jgi:hypothetical protein
VQDGDRLLDGRHDSEPQIMAKIIRAPASQGSPTPAMNVRRTDGADRQPLRPADLHRGGNVSVFSTSTSKPRNFLSSDMATLLGLSDYRDW